MLVDVKRVHLSKKFAEDKTVPRSLFPAPADRARCKADGKVVAIKYLRTNDEDDGFPITAVREIALMLDFSHPNVVETYGVAASVHNDHG